MGNYYYCYCVTCKEFFFLGKESEWLYDEEKMYCFKDFLLSHIDHYLTVGGDTWNCANSVIKFNKKETMWDFRKKGWKEFDSRSSKQDFTDE